MNQRTLISLFLGFTLFIGVFVLFIAMNLQNPSSSSSVENDSGFPFIYLALMVIAFGGVLLGIIIRLRR
jgi:Na+/proline symporter